ncbi:uncharacterized protein LOC106654390 [Trichogramma pretiosum]|uniref:uncharacterized protein LOC106654390 n=1 Tax=Trichogramma pretiosum TaxID=7493 RepID=UPI0006C95E4A|nr:uncharacterized protein LOC106654390 [Trichogramma pretiosum]
MSKESSAIKTAQHIPAIKILPAQLARLKKEEEEETWISGEELYTEGSSDEENSHSCAKPTLPKSSFSKINALRQQQARTRSTEKRGKSSLAIESTSSSRQASLEDHHQSSPRSSMSDEEYVPDDEISWKVNRGAGARQQQQQQQQTRLTDSQDFLQHS